MNSRNSYWKRFGSIYVVFLALPLGSVLFFAVLVGLAVQEQISARSRANTIVTDALQESGLNSIEELKKRELDPFEAESPDWARINGVLQSEHVKQLLLWSSPDPFQPIRNLADYLPRFDDNEILQSFLKSFLADLQPTIDSIHVQMEAPHIQVPQWGDDITLATKLLRLDCIYASLVHDHARVLRDLQSIATLAAPAKQADSLPGRRYNFQANHAKADWQQAVARVIESDQLDLETLKQIEMQLASVRNSVQVPMAKSAMNAIVLDSARQLLHELADDPNSMQWPRQLSDFSFLVPLPSHVLMFARQQEETEEKGKALREAMEKTMNDYFDMLEVAIFFREFELEHGRWPNRSEFSPRADILYRGLYGTILDDNHAMAICTNNIWAKANVSDENFAWYLKPNEIGRSASILYRGVIVPNLVILKPTKK